MHEAVRGKGLQLLEDKGEEGVEGEREAASSVQLYTDTCCVAVVPLNRNKTQFTFSIESCRNS